jgi:GR25 family glycosyltransferase involved in LPS biosynthesis
VGIRLFATYGEIPEWARNCIVIGDNKLREIIITKELDSLGFKPILIEPNVFKEWPEYFSKNRSLAITRRTLSLGELGCAKSHLDSYDYFLNCNRNLTLVFEDDAYLPRENQIDFLNALHEIDQIEGKLNDSSNVYSFYSESAIASSSSFLNTNFYVTYGEPSHAVAYVINRSAALNFKLVNKHLDFQADWPKSNVVNFFLYSHSLITHGDPSKPKNSLLEVSRKSVALTFPKAFFLVIKTLLFITYFQNRQYFLASNYFFKNSFLPIFRWRLLRACSKQFGNWSPGVRQASGNNFFRFLFKRPYIKARQ